MMQEWYKIGPDVRTESVYREKEGRTFHLRKDHWKLNMNFYIEPRLYMVVVSLY